MQNALPSVGDLYSTAFNRLKTNFWYYIKNLFLVLLMFAVIATGLVIIFGTLSIVLYPEYMGIIGIILGVGAVISLLFLASWISAAGLSILSNPMHVSAKTHMLYAWKRTPTMVGANLLSNLMITLGLILFILPGIYLYIRNFFTQIAIAKNGITTSEAFEQSRVVSAGRWWKILGYILAAGIPVMIAVILTQLPFLWTESLVILLPAFILYFVVTITGSIFLSLYFLALFEAATQQPQAVIEA